MIASYESICELPATLNQVIFDTELAKHLDKSMHVQIFSTPFLALHIATPEWGPQCIGTK